MDPPTVLSITAPERNSAYFIALRKPHSSLHYAPCLTPYLSAGFMFHTHGEPMRSRPHSRSSTRCPMPSGCLRSKNVLARFLTSRTTHGSSCSRSSRTPLYRPCGADFLDAKPRMGFCNAPVLCARPAARGAQGNYVRSLPNAPGKMCSSATPEPSGALRTARVAYRSHLWR